MSKLQKKKTLADKKKRKTGGDQENGVAVAAPASPVKPSSSGVVAKSKTEKSVVNPGDGSLFSKAAEFLREVQVELKKVTWPTRTQTTGTTVVVIVFVFVVAAFLGLFDFSLSRLVQIVLT